MVVIKKLISKIYYKIESNKLKEVDIKNHTYYYFDDAIRIEDFDFDKVLMDEKSYKNILVHYISHTTVFG